MKKGVSLIVLILTIIVIIILAAAVVLTLTQNNPIIGAKEATFKEDIVEIQDELSMYLSKKYLEDSMGFVKSSVNLSGDDMITVLPSTKKYKNKVSVIKGKLVWNGSTDENEYKWFSQVTDGSTKKDESVRDEWKNTVSEEIEGVPIPKGFTYKEGTKDTGIVIQDKKGNEFVWVSATEATYVKNTSYSDDTLPNGVSDEISDVKKYGGFYIGRYEAGIPDGETSPSNKTGIPVSKKGATVWTNIDYSNAKASAESMINDKNSVVQTGLITGRTWGATCNWIEDSLSKIDPSADLVNSQYYGNYQDSTSPANVAGYGSKQVAGFSEYWKTKNIYDLAGNVSEFATEILTSFSTFCMGGNYNSYSTRGGSVVYSTYIPLDSTGDYIGFRVRLYIK